MRSRPRWESLVKERFAETGNPDETEVGVDQRCEALLRRLAVLDEHTVKAALAMPGDGNPGIDERTTALVRLAGLGALLRCGSPGAYERRIAETLSAGVSAEEIVAILIDVAPTLGLARLVPGAVELALALGYDIDRALEEPDERLT